MAPALSPETAAAIRATLDAAPDGVLEEVARRHGVPLRAVLDCLPPACAEHVPGRHFESVWQAVAEWGTVMFIVHTADGVFETRTALAPGSLGRGFFNVHGGAPLGGHLRADRCAAIYFVDRPFFGRRSCSLQFINGDGEGMFKIFVARDERRELLAEQVARFERLRETLLRTDAGIAQE